ncbi:MAG: hypothetical protein HKN10_18175 [Myxococcales bacterium]|nr:hypothetical protein [Myxococcales bacterium]
MFLRFFAVSSALALPNAGEVVCDGFMSDLAALLSILVVVIVTFFGSYWVNKMINERGDEILSGVVSGIPQTAKTRWLMLFTQWLPYTVFFIAFLLVVGVGFLEVAREIEHPRVELVGYMCATLCMGGAAFWSILGFFLFAHMLSVLRTDARS